MIVFPIIALAAVAASPSASPKSPHCTKFQSALMVSPTGPVAAIVVSALGNPTIDANLKFHRMSKTWLGWSVQADFLRTRMMDVHVTHGTLRAGPRFALRKRGLTDWSLTPFASFGYTSIAAAGERLAHYGVLGFGVDALRTWAWNHFIMELGAGVYMALPVGYRPKAEVVVGRKANSIFPVKPSFSWSAGYAF